MRTLQVSFFLEKETIKAIQDGLLEVRYIPASPVASVFQHALRSLSPVLSVELSHMRDAIGVLNIY